MMQNVKTCDVCGMRIPTDRAEEWFAGIDGALFRFAHENGEPIDTCAKCHGVFRFEILDRLNTARELRRMEREPSWTVTA